MCVICSAEEAVCAEAAAQPPQSRDHQHRPITINQSTTAGIG
jgi:hypothetical protein